MLSRVVTSLCGVLKLCVCSSWFWWEFMPLLSWFYQWHLLISWTGGALSGLLAWLAVSKNVYSNFFFFVISNKTFFFPELPSAWNKWQWISDSLSPALHNLTCSAYLCQLLMPNISLSSLWTVSVGLPRSAYLPLCLCVLSSWSALLSLSFLIIQILSLLLKVNIRPVSSMQLSPITLSDIDLSLLWSLIMSASQLVS